METYVEIENPPAECEEDFYDSDDYNYNYEYEDSTCIKVHKKPCSFVFLKKIIMSIRSAIRIIYHEDINGFPA